MNARRTIISSSSSNIIRSLSSPAQPPASAAQAQEVIRITGTIPQGGVGVVVSQYAQVERRFTAQDVSQFGNLVHDNNPLHQEWPVHNLPLELQSHPLLLVENSNNGNSSGKNDICAETTTTRAIVHGMLVSSLFSSIFGTLVPGAVYLKQSLDFKSPVHVDELVVGRVDITRVRQFPTTKRGGEGGGGVIVTCDTRVRLLLPRQQQQQPGSNNNSIDDDVVETKDCVVGTADVWLPSGSKG